MEELFDAITGGAVWGVGFAVAASLIGGFGRGLRPLAKTVVKGGVVTADWVRSATEESRETMQDIYAEAQAERNEALTEKAARGARKADRGQAQGAKAEHGGLVTG